ncbi:RicAFT regulatory complex protein RicA family protein [Paenibacillus sp. GSMTC-2017]|uniref:RicAFT regulatory complex protein RicA family protein n=1 Tax=Paenibacillus sp. GSMTC-2017 TaxID=2794350 RepID=UPI0018D5D15F|nr:YlbF family regulator [Paenibacillus sp. GSMTC-2017]MBH5316552.1 RicAFT regulatory complex protein RicA family protein [Paenibacillus sp. GSMTC-2017]
MAEQQMKTGAGQHDHSHGVACSHHGGTEDIPSFHTRDLIVKEDIMAKTKELAEIIFNSEEVQLYRRAEQQINANEKVQQLITKIKKKQKEVVAFETTFKNPDMVKKIEAEMEVLQDELDGMPIVSQFQQSQSDINYLLQLVVTIIRDTVSDRINVEDANEPAPEECSD